MERGEATGKIKVAYTMEILKETRILNSLNSTGLNRSMSSDSIPRNSPSKLLGKGLKDVELGIVEDNEGVEEEVIYFPFTLIVIDLLTIELKPVHKLLKNVPIVKAIVDQSFQETPVSVLLMKLCSLSYYSINSLPLILSNRSIQFTKDTQDTMEWKNLKWKFVMKEESELKIAVESRSVSIGKIILSGEDVRGIPRNQQGIREVTYPLR